MNLDRDYSALDAEGVRFEPDPSRPRQQFATDPVYRPTPLRLVQAKGRGQLFIKDETARLGLPAFKALGGVYAVARLISERWFRHSGERLEGAALGRGELKSFAAGLTFVCASAGNHGLAVASGARQWGAAARVHLAENVPAAFAERLQRMGAEVCRSGADYDASVSAAIEDAKSSGDILLADGSWPGYLEPPALVMEGYTLMAGELREQFTAFDNWPDRVYLQAGVGGMAAAIAHMIRSNWSQQPQVIVVEPEAAPCLGASHAAGRIVRVEGPESNMGRLDCKLPSLLALESLSRTADRFIVVGDSEAEGAAVRMESFGVATTSSGAAGLAGAQREGAFPADIKVLVIATEAALPQ